ncbi:uncharacterized protein MYCFIDRAFT_63916 [Pseudocercospora fijiensis CIRAD86]|uniref:DUF605-domain-containing protein n=1 Tax=Pseudocercospora fijiensis (strain CIRAD86) TaxID=383855 RepID=M3APX5_PSEFD|nr:uncharacterized protein MYCFIDRAFT_63916 [Pseudocercospora fijiensis CIRAD86]EME79497.1 hypothetical protein MYCFIDRAFT_63916 [Pseudocercospora fijiensis CIRAD86]
MATAIPAKLKAAAPDVQRFATRAAQLAKHRPIVTYWCEYYILQQILSRQLHTSDEDCTNYAIRLMDKLEAYKAENAANDAVIDDVAAKAYIENFALEVFTGGDEAQRNNKVIRQTADTFQAAATFMDLLTIWGPLEPEFVAKSKFAKYHALRIAKAIKAGEDPNATNPVVEQPLAPGSEDVSLEAELKNMENDAGVYKPPTVENVPDSGFPSRSPSALQTDPVAPPALPTRGVGDISQPRPTEHDVSPIEPPEDVASRTGSIGGGYFPTVPDAPSNVNAVAPVDQPPSVASSLPPSSAAPNPADFYNIPPPVESTTTPRDLGNMPQDRPGCPLPHQQMASTPLVAPSQPPVRAPVPSGEPTNFNAAPPPGGYRDDDESIMAAQKHAKWAISALNFEDVQTAVKELRIALQSLGAS